MVLLPALMSPIKDPEFAPALPLNPNMGFGESVSPTNIPNTTSSPRPSPPNFLSMVMFGSTESIVVVPPGIVTFFAGPLITIVTPIPASGTPGPVGFKSIDDPGFTNAANVFPIPLYFLVLNLATVSPGLLRVPPAP